MSYLSSPIVLRSSPKYSLGIRAPGCVFKLSILVVIITNYHYIYPNFQIVILPTVKKTGICKGFGFVQFHHDLEAKAAMEEMQGKVCSVISFKDCEIMPCLFCCNVVVMCLLCSVVWLESLDIAIKGKV